MSVYYCIMYSYVLIATHACVSSIMTTYEFDGKICVSWMPYYCSNMWSKLASKTHFIPYMDWRSTYIVEVSLNPCVQHFYWSLKCEHVNGRDYYNPSKRTVVLMVSYSLRSPSHMLSTFANYGSNKFIPPLNIYYGYIMDFKLSHIDRKVGT